MKRLLFIASLAASVVLMLSSSAAPQGTPMCAVAAAGESPIAWWPADGMAIDIVNGTDGSLQYGATYDAGVAGQAFTFNGVDQNVTVANRPSWNLGSHDFSIMLWAKSNATDQVAPFVSHDEGGGPSNKWIFWAGWSYGLVFHINSPTIGEGIDVIACYQCAMTPGQWYHLAVTRKGPLYVLYINGVPIAHASDTHFIPMANAPLQIGGAEGFSFNGSIDEVKIYHRALSPAEVRSFGFMQGAAALTVR